jgi:DNA uptake protein ComE-like DNA-binding protein
MEGPKQSSYRGDPVEVLQHAGPHETSSNRGLFNVNTATEEELTYVELIRDVDARKIVEARKHHGAFRSWEELEELTGLDGTKIAELQRAARLTPLGR